MKTAKEVYDGMASAAIRKSNLSLEAFLGLAFLAGLYIAFGGLAASTMQALVGPLNIGLGKALGALVFSIGLTATIVTGAELFTGNILMSCGLKEGRICFGPMLKNWFLVYTLNFVGSLALVALSYYGHAVPEDAAMGIATLAETKTSLTISELLWRGIGCNFLVCLGVWMAAAAEEISSKMLAAAFPVFIFVFLGYEHSVANMFYLPFGYLLGADISISSIFYNLLWVTLGNIIGGLFIAGPFMLAYHAKK